MILVDKLRKNFGDLVAVDGVSFEVSPGEVFALLGPNGAGKTTIVRILTTLLRASSGNVLLDGLDLARDPGKVRSRFGVVFQDSSLDRELTAQENLELHGVLYRIPRRLRRARSRLLLEKFGLWERRHELVHRYSGGMMRRLEIARAMLHQPRVLFLDEPTLGLDPQSRNHLWSHVQELNRTESMTVFLTTHHMEEAERMATRVGVIDHGRLAALGPPAELRRRTGKDSLEQAFLALTGTSAARHETASAVEDSRRYDRTWRTHRRELRS